MRHQTRPVRSVITFVSLAAALSGCAGGDALSGRQIVDDLERSGVPVPDNSGVARHPEVEAGLPASGPISLADLLRAAEARSPSLAAARSGAGVAAGQRWQASLYPNPHTDVLVEDVSSNGGFSGSKTTVGITQPIILGDRRQAAMDAAGAEQAARMAEVEARRRTLFGDIAAEHIHLVSLREQEALYRELRGLADRTLTAATTRFEAHSVPETEVLRPRVEAYRIDAAVGRLTQQQAASARRLGLLIGGLAVEPSRVEGSIPRDPAGLNVETLQAMVRAAHPELVVADREIEAAAARLVQVRAARTPDLDVRLATGYRSEYDDGIVEFGAGVSLPLWDNRQGDILSARFGLMRARQQRIQVENGLFERLAASVGEYEAARAQFTTFRDQLVPDAQRAFDQTSEGYRGGRATFLDVLDTQRTLTEARITLAELASAVATARAGIMQTVGPDGLGASDGAPTPALNATVPSTTPERPEGAEAKP